MKLFGRLHILVLILLVLAGSVLFRNLDSLTLRMWDESRNAINAMEMKNNGNFIVVKFEGEPDLWNTKPPLLCWGITCCMKVFGANEFSVRLPSVISTLVIVVVIFLVVYFVSDKNLLALIPGLTMVTLPGFIHYHVARNGDFDAMLTMWVFLGSVSFYLWVNSERPCNIYLILASLFFVGSVLTKGIASFMILPGLFVYVLVKGKLLQLLKSKVFYLSILFFVIPVFGYYYLREKLSPGYLQAVSDNELLGRFTETQEGHIHEWSYYFTNLFNERLGVWIYVYLLSIPVYLLFGRNSPLGKLMFFSIVCSVSYLVVISISKTKLPWYDSVSYPFISIVCGVGLIILIEKLISIISLNRIFKSEIIRISAIIILLFYPVYYIHADTSVKSTFENTYPELYYGDMIKSFFKYHPKEKLTVIYDDYNGHALFYIRGYQNEGYRIAMKKPSDIFHSGELVLVCEDGYYQSLIKGYEVDPVFHMDSRHIVKIRHPHEIVDHGKEDFIMNLASQKIMEIKQNNEWFLSIEAKAKQNNVKVEEQLVADALYVLESEGLISAEDVNIVKGKLTQRLIQDKLHNIGK